MNPKSGLRTLAKPPISPKSHITLRQFTFNDMLEDKGFTSLPIEWEGTPEDAKAFATNSGYQWRHNHFFIFNGYWWNPKTQSVLLPV